MAGELLILSHHSVLLNIFSGLSDHEKLLLMTEALTSLQQLLPHPQLLFQPCIPHLDLLSLHTGWVPPPQGPQITILKHSLFFFNIFIHINMRM